MSYRVHPGINLSLGIEVDIGDDVVFAGVGNITIGDYVKIHRGTFVTCHSTLSIGHNCWIGERCVIDGTGGLTIGNNVGVGIGSSIYTHMSFGDTFSGCNFRSSRSIKIGDDAWMLGQVTVQGCNIASKTIVMPMSHVTFDITEQNEVWSGNPASNCTGDYGCRPWSETTVEQRTKRFNLLVKCYADETGRDVGWIRCVGSMPSDIEDDATYFCMDDRTYTKRKFYDERLRYFMRWLLRHNKAKFTPRGIDQ
jgi:acetyltransferase-like isoleucine patch superfamily enzyme